MNNEVTSSTAAAFLVNHGSAAVFGMIGAAILWIVLPPLDKQGRFNRIEFVGRLFVAGVSSIFFGGMLAEAVQPLMPWINTLHHQSTFDLVAGAPAWWVTRAVALWFHKRRDKDIGEIIKEVRENKDV
jgi:hypothetical protein